MEAPPVDAFEEHRTHLLRVAYRITGSLADAEDASREVTRFDAELGGEIAPFSSVLLRAVTLRRRPAIVTAPIQRSRPSS